MSWNYRITREALGNADGGVDYFYAVREVYYDDAGNVTAWTEEPTTFTGGAPDEVADSLARASGAFAGGVLDLDTRETVRVTLDGSQVR